jgi:hypothetical protein
MAAYKSVTPAKPSKPASKPRTNYLKPKEVCQSPQVASGGVLTCSAPRII